MENWKPYSLQMELKRLAVYFKSPYYRNCWIQITVQTNLSFLEYKGPYRGIIQKTKTTTKRDFRLKPTFRLTTFILCRGFVEREVNLRKTFFLLHTIKMVHSCVSTVDWKQQQQRDYNHANGGDVLFHFVFESFYLA